MNSILLFLAGLLALVLSALFAAPYFVDWNDYRDVFEAQASKLIGRKVDVGGDVSLALLPAPVLRFETINVADAKGGFDTPFASARSLTVWLSVPPLLRGTIEARSVEIDQPVINLRLSKDGTGNWSDLGGEAADLPFLPKNVALNSVLIDAATVNFWRGKAEPSSIIEKLDGELSARSLQGPYKFTGQFELDGKHRDLRFSTGLREDNGDFRLKASVRNPENKDTYSIDGSVRGLRAVPAFKGKFRARLADKLADTPVDAGKTTKGEEQKSAPAAPVEIKSELLAGLTGAEFSDTEVTVTKNNKPQTLRGLLDAKFGEGLVIAGTFSSRWVDIDSWLQKENDAPLKLNTALGGLAKEILDRVSGVKQGSLKLFFDQAVLAGDLTTNLRASLDIADNKLEVTSFSAKLPGNNRLRLEGTLSAGKTGPVFTGPVSLNGDALLRLFRWAGVSQPANSITQQGEFLLKGKLTLRPDGIALRDGEGELFGSAFNGGFNYRGGVDGEISLTLKSERMDLARLFGSSGSKVTLRDFIAAERVESEDAPFSQSLAWLGKLQARADVSIGAISLPGLEDGVLEAKLALKEGVLDIHKLLVNSGKDLNIQAAGRLTGLNSEPQGELTLAVQAGTGQGLSALGAFLNVPENVLGSPEGLAAFAPVNVTAAIRSSEPEESEAKGLSTLLEGTVGTSDLKMKIDFAGAPADWISGRLGVQGSMTNASGKALLQQLRPQLRTNDLAGFDEGEGTLSLEVNGVPESGMQTRLFLNAGGTNWTTQGTYRIEADQSSLSGTTAFTAKNVAAGLTLLGIHMAPGHAQMPGSFTADIESSSGKHVFKNLQGKIGDASFSGEMDVISREETTSIDADIEANKVSLPALFGSMVSWEPANSDAGMIRGVSKVDGYWPSNRFNTALFDEINGTLKLKAERVLLTGGLVLFDAKMQATLSNGAMNVSRLEGDLYGGTLKASGQLAKRGGGMALDAKAEAEGLQLEKLTITSSGAALVHAPADMVISVKGVGLTPRGIAASLTGKGSIEFGSGKIKGFSLGAAHVAAMSAQKEKSKGGVDEAVLGQRITDNLKNSEMSFSQISVPFIVRNGVAEFEKVALSDAEGRATVTSYLQFSTLQLDSEWALQTAGLPGEDKSAKVSLVFSGALENIGKFKPRIDTTGLARYVTIRKMQQDVEKLEKLDVTGTAPVASGKPEEKTPAVQVKKITKMKRITPPETGVPPEPVEAPIAIERPAASRQPAVPLPERRAVPAVSAPSVAAVPVPATPSPPVSPAAPAAPKTPAPLPSRKPPAPPRPAVPANEPRQQVPVAAPQPVVELPWLQQSVPVPAPAPAPAQGADALPVTADDGSPQALVPENPPVAPAPPPARRRRKTFEPFSEESGG
ncbi:MAG: AsmA family protein [Alphaproteobacteria bacterium]